MDNFHDKLKYNMDEYAHFVYRFTKTFPKDELFGVTSQLRRASLSVILNYTEGFARQSERANLSFLNISYGSLKESKYLLNFSFREEYINEIDYNKALPMAEEIGAMLWTTIQNKRRNLK